MTLKSGLFNSVNGDRKYKADDFAAYFATFISDGVFPNPSTGFQVTTTNSMTVSLKAGQAWIKGYYATNDADYNIQLDVADGVLKRIDRIVLQLNYASRQIVPVVKKGVFASTPVAPAVQRDADAYELVLADILVGNGVLSITQANITDQRLNTALCGIVHGTVNQVDTTTIFNQYQSWFNMYSVNKKVEFDDWSIQRQATFNTWFQNIQAILDGNVAANLQTQIDQFVSIQGTEFVEIRSDIDGVKNDIALHVSESMPHTYMDSGKLYRWGFRTKNGIPQFIREELV